MTSWARRLNDRSLEGLIALARGASLLALLVAMAMPFVILWADSGHVRGAALGTTLVCAVIAAGLGWWGWYHMGNVEWAPPLTCRAVYGLYRCRVQPGTDGTHEGPHWDNVADPEGRYTWS